MNLKAEVDGNVLGIFSSNGFGLKSGSLNLLEPSRPVKACNGIALMALVSATVNIYYDIRKLMEHTVSDVRAVWRSY
jgi:hypothetical protein